MHKLRAVLNGNNPNKDNQFDNLVAQANDHLKLQEFWEAAISKKLSKFCSIGGIKNQKLSIYAHNASVASKIKLTSTSILSQLQYLQKNDANFIGFKVTAISVKVQVKSQQKHVTTTPRKLSSHASATLKNFAADLGETELADKLIKLANNIQK